MNSERQAFLQHLDEAHTQADWLARAAVFADWLEEREDWLAKWWRKSSYQCETCKGVLATKADWGTGTWQSEPNKRLFEACGLPCLLHRGPAGHWNGYVGVSQTHPVYGKGYDNCNFEVHGGPTWADDVEVCSDEKGFWWLGFDCGHAFDVSPGIITPGITNYSGMQYSYHYWTLAEVRAETEELARQLAEMI